MKIKALAPNEENPRTVSPAKLAQLKKAMLKFGDLSGIIFNRKSKSLVGGHQRTKHFESSADVVITKQYKTPTKTGTVAEGYVLLNGERFNYREVAWDKNTERAANIAANNNAGVWDMPQLSEWLRDLGSFDVDFDVSLMMFDAAELKAFAGITVKEHTRKKNTGVEKEEKVKAPAQAKAGQVFNLGPHTLLAGAAELHAVDEIIARWEKASGQKAKLAPKTVVKKNTSLPMSKAAHA